MQNETSMTKDNVTMPDGKMKVSACQVHTNTTQNRHLKRIGRIHSTENI